MIILLSDYLKMEADFECILNLKFSYINTKSLINIHDSIFDSENIFNMLILFFFFFN